MNIGHLYTRPIQDHNSVDRQIGQFLIDVNIVDAIFYAAPDKSGEATRAVSMHLASAIQDTQVPAEMWRFEPTDKIRRAFNWPEIMYFGGKP